MFTSDNGGLSTAEGSPTCNAPLREGKGWTEEGGIRVPLIVWGPGRVASGVICDAVVTLADLYPTLLEGAGLPLLPTQHRDGVSLGPVLTGVGDLQREAVLWHNPHYSNRGGTPSGAIRVGE